MFICIEGGPPIAPALPKTDIGRAAVSGYARYLDVPPEKFLKNMGPRQSAADVGEAVLSVKPRTEVGSIFTISADGLAAAS